MNLPEAYRQVQERVKGMDFGSLWPGFKAYDFALYDASTVMLNDVSFPRTDEFLANTAILYKGKPLAIWQLSGDMDPDILASKLIHEMFHAYQGEMGEARFPNEMEALQCYEYTPAYLQLKRDENLLLASLAEHYNENTLSKFLAHRKMRQERFSFQYQYESGIEAIEGPATYVEMQALALLSSEKYDRAFRNALEKIRSVEALIPIRIISYDVGFVFLQVCADNHLPVDMRVGGSTDAMFHVLMEQTPYRFIENPIQPDILSFCVQDQKRLESKIAKIIADCKKPVFCDYELLGVNVYSARHLNGYVISEYFIQYKDVETVTLYGNYVIKLHGNRICEIYEES